jgi:WD40 repeat protein
VVKLNIKYLAIIIKKDKKQMNFFKNNKIILLAISLFAIYFNIKIDFSTTNIYYPAKIPDTPLHDPIKPKEFTITDPIPNVIKPEEKQLLFKKASKTFRGHTKYVNSVAISPNGKYIVSGSYDKTIKLWNINTGELIRSFKGHTWSVKSVAISPGNILFQGVKI